MGVRGQRPGSSSHWPARSCSGPPGHSTAPRPINARHLASTMDTLVSPWASSPPTPGRRPPSSLGRGTSADLYFEVAAVVTTFLLLGRWLEARARAHAGSPPWETLLSLGAKDVAVQRIDASTRATTEFRIPIEDLRLWATTSSSGPARRSPPTGSSSTARAPSTPRSSPGRPFPWTQAPLPRRSRAAPLNTYGRLVVEAQRVGSETTLAAVAALVENAQTGKADVQRLADRISAVFVPVVLTLALLTFAGVVARDRRPGSSPGGRGGRADHRVPVRPRARHTHSAVGRARGAGRSWASSSKDLRSSRTLAGSTRSSWTRLAPSPPALSPGSPASRHRWPAAGALRR